MTNDGKDLERLIQLIEKSITPDATVEHNVNMPILNSRIGATTQCDIVIRSGVQPRQTITIIEAQDRGSKVKPNDFRGWKQKLDDIGAQHLICVSRQDFPKSIKEQASLSGGTIMLITLKESMPDSLPLDFLRMYYQFRNFDVISLNYVRPSMSKSEAIALGVRDSIHDRTSIETNDRCWSIDKSHVITLFQLCRDYYVPPMGLVAGVGKISFDLKNNPPLYYLIDNVFIRAGLDCEFEWTDEIIEKQMSILTYEQDDLGTLAWVAEIIHESPKGMVVFRMPIMKSGDNYVIRTFYAETPENVDTQLVILRRSPNNIVGT